MQVRENKIFRIPDFLIFKESGNQVKYATEPILIVEVLSDSSAKTGRTTKLNEYRMIPSLHYYMIVEQDSCFVEIYIRDGERWYVALYDQLHDKIVLEHFSLEIALDMIYKKITFQPGK